LTRIKPLLYRGDINDVNPHEAISVVSNIRDQKTVDFVDWCTTEFKVSSATTHLSRQPNAQEIINLLVFLATAQHLPTISPQLIKNSARCMPNELLYIGSAVVFKKDNFQRPEKNAPHSIGTTDK
jgi:UDP-N-acetyl-D-mannosaminuronate dehydrogenase